MKFSYNWIRELVPGVDSPPRELGQLITMKTAECEGVEPFAPFLDQVCAARVISVEPVPGSSHNSKAVVDTGRYGVKTVVCGAPNCRAGMVTAYVPAGVDLNGKHIGRAVIEGVESDGMLASGAELGLNRDADGILDIDAEPGAPLPGCSVEHVIEIDNKSLTHRPDLWGHHGMAREVAAITRKPLTDPVKLELIPPGEPQVNVAIEDFDLCPRYSALVFENVTVQPSPLWLQARLEAIGLNPISNIVDVTNWVMAELAQPLHAFDADRLKGHTIYIRPARECESIIALNEERYELTPQALVIADEGGPVAIAGVIGGMESAISGVLTGATNRIVLESANFQAAGIRKTSQRLKLRTDASMRFEKAQDPENTIRGLARAAELLMMVSPGIRIVGGLADSRRPHHAPPPIRFSMEWLQRKLGRSIEASEVRDILESLQFGVIERSPGVFFVSVPTWRATKDISIADDLVEEVGRMIGYGSITPKAPLVPAAPPPANPRRAFQHGVRELVAAQGFTEVYNYSFISEEMAQAFGWKPEEHLAVANPISVEQGLMRLSLLPGIRRNILDNARHFDSFRLFEIGREIHPRGAELPAEITHLAAVAFAKDDGLAGLMEAKRLAECVCPGAEVRPGKARSYEHPARAAEVIWRGETVGRLFELHPMLAPGRAAILDLDLDAVERLKPARARYTPLRRFPSSGFDLSVIAPLRALAGDLQAHIARYSGDLVESVEFVRVYTGPPLAGDQKSVSFRVTVGAPDRTLASEDVAQIRQRAIDGMRELGYDLRV